MTQRESYEMVDRFLRNSMHDEAYADYSAALDDACGFNQAAQPAHHLPDAGNMVAQPAQIPEGWREFIENIAKANSEPLNSLAGGSDKASRRHWLGVIRNRARDLLAAAPSPKE